MSSQAASHVMRTTVERIVLHQFTPLHCVQARAMLGWSHEQLSRESGVSVGAIQRFEAGAPLRDVTRLALAFRFEAEGLVFFPGFAPGRGMNIRGTTPDPIERKDYELIE
ncbi:helix-turn-helix domain-containing protein [Pseudomonas sp. FEN]|uniref:helix-turn-helix domain-containing protein n=1 Tax=Pseudomonas sp. FEN TaxID=2767468 RepID=UPI00174B3001|nr:helix-turn-helix transcriptional regulator [Pseudomonas sp. FEN]